MHNNSTVENKIYKKVGKVIFLIEIKNYSEYKGSGEYIGRFNYYHELKASPLKNPFTGPIKKRAWNGRKSEDSKTYIKIKEN